MELLAHRQDCYASSEASSTAQTTDMLALRSNSTPLSEQCQDPMQRLVASKRTALISAGFVTILGMGLAAGEAGAQRWNGKQREDARTCESFGNRYGTPAFSDCMLAQQHRRDTKQLRSIEETERLSQIAKDGQIMADRARRQRCERNPDRRECRRKYLSE